MGRLSLPIVLLLMFLGQMIGASHVTSFSTDFFALDSDSSQLWKHPWSIMSYGFIHASVAHFVTTAVLLLYLVLYFRYPSSAVIWGQFVLGTLVGGILFLVFSPERVPVRSTLVGASAGVCALVPSAVLSLFRPGQRSEMALLKLLPLVLILILDIFALYSQTNWGILAHLGGYTGGGLWVLGTYLIYKSHQRKQETDDEKRRGLVIEKANRSGYSSLTEDERIMLEHRERQGIK